MGSPGASLRGPKRFPPWTAGQSAAWVPGSTGSRHPGPAAGRLLGRELGDLSAESSPALLSEPVWILSV